jgi:hypothetical protein
MMPHNAVQSPNMELQQVTSRLEPELRKELTDLRDETGRSEAQEIRQAVKFWLAHNGRPAGRQLSIGAPS